MMSAGLIPGLDSVHKEQGCTSHGGFGEASEWGSNWVGRVVAAALLPESSSGHAGTGLLWEPGNCLWNERAHRLPAIHLTQTH